MERNLENGTVGIPTGSLLRIDDGAGALLHVWEGELWVTQEGSRKDVVLQAGQSFRIERDGATIVHAFSPSKVSLSSRRPQAPGALRRLIAALVAPTTAIG
jgi:hypothetical protein